MTPYLWPIRYGDYSTILKYFAIRSALADFGVYVIALRELWNIRRGYEQNTLHNEKIPTEHLDPLREKAELNRYYSQFVTSRFFMIFLIYCIALLIGYFIPSYTSNPYLIRWLPFGMLFSASFMAAGILQLPLQLFWKMDQVSIGLIIARIVQLAILGIGVYIIFPHPTFSNTGPISPFLMILISVVASGIAQWWYIYRIGRKYLSFSWIRDRKFTKKLIIDNRQYGIAYYLSSFHTLIVLILLSIFFPTIQDFDYVGIRALALSLLEIMLIVPSSLGNSLIHKVSHLHIDQKLSSFGALLNIVVWISSIVTINFYWFAPQIIRFIWGTKFLATSSSIGSDTILPFLGIVLILSFIKQVFNYVFVSTHMHNKLLRSNFFGVAIGLTIGIPVIYYHNLWGATITQVILELWFAIGAWWIAWKHRLIPVIDRKFLWYLIITIIIAYLIRPYIPLFQGNYLRIISALCINSIITLIWWKSLKKIWKSL